MRYTRHELKQDKFAATAKEAVHWTVEHRNKLVNGAIAAVIVVVVVVGALWFMHHRDQQAADALGKAMVVYEAPLRAPAEPADPERLSFTSPQERAIAAKAEFHKVASDFGATKSGKYAKYFAGLAEVESGNSKVAEEQLKYVADLRDSDLASLAKLSLASLYRDSGRDNDAVSIYKELIDHPTRTVPKATAQLQLAETYAAKQPADAKKLYEQIAKDNPNSVAGEVANQHASELK